MVRFHTVKFFFLLALGIFLTLEKGRAFSNLPSHCEAIGKAQGARSINFETQTKFCFDQVLERSRINRRLFSSASNGDIKVFAFKNLIFIQKQSKLSLISGDMTKVNNIEGISLSEDGKTIAVLDGFKDEKGYWRKQILFFESSLNGNVAAFSMNNDLVVSYAKAISFAGSEQIILNLKYPAYAGRPERSEIVSFDKYGDSRSALPKNKPSAKLIMSSITNSSISNLVSITATGSQLFTLSPEEIQVFSLEKGSYRLTNTLKNDGQLSSSFKEAQHITYDPSKKSIRLYNNSGLGSAVQF